MRLWSSDEIFNQVNCTSHCVVHIVQCIKTQSTAKYTLTWGSSSIGDKKESKIKEIYAGKTRSAEGGPVGKPSDLVEQLVHKYIRTKFEARRQTKADQKTRKMQGEESGMQSGREIRRAAEE